MASGVTHMVLANAAYKRRELGVACVPIRRPGTGIPDEEPVGAVNGPVATTGTRNARPNPDGIGFLTVRQTEAEKRCCESILDRRSRKGGGRSMTVDEGALIDGGATMGDEEYSAVDGGRVGPHKMGIYTEWLPNGSTFIPADEPNDGIYVGPTLAFRRSAKKERNRVIRVDDFPIFEKNTKTGSDAPTWVADLQEMACLKRRAAKELSSASYPFQVSLVSVSDCAGQKEKDVIPEW
ncbi:hypothetical protein EDB83DRAFT_2324692 [Lactarius deliciosus]|nr:hypothetical protein EDB83DRAFT_2324692 [Lactarius deliciosus]